MKPIERRLGVAALIGLLGCASIVGAAPPAFAVDVQTAWHYGTDRAAGSAATHVARIEQGGHVLAYACDSRRGRRFTVDVWQPQQVPQHDTLTLAFVFESGEPNANTRHRIDVAARPTGRDTGVVVKEPAANALLLELLDGRHDRLTIETEGVVRAFSLSGAAAAVRRANVACSTGLPAATAPADTAWDVFGYGGLFEIAMPDDAEEVAASIPLDGRTVRYGGLRGSDGDASYTAIVSDIGRRGATPDERAQFFTEFVAGTLEGARRNGAVVRDMPAVGGDGLARDLRLDYANGTTQFMRIVMVDTRVYLLTTTCRADARTIARKDRFLASFRTL
ncbi:MAG: hypothetical protein KIT36_04760 [Alphaproteobacteria bacterium]|nr:hypothetical protein [Alphaproteobacteria bacterium]